MSLPKRLYDLYRAMSSSELVSVKNCTPDTMLAFQDLLNQCSPTTPEETTQKEMIRGMYYSNPTSFLKYVSQPKNRVGALVLYTESKRIARFFDLHKLVHISWSDETSTYTVSPHIPREKRATNVGTSVEELQAQLDTLAITDPDIAALAAPGQSDAELKTAPYTTRREKYVNRHREQRNATGKHKYVPPLQAKTGYAGGKRLPNDVVKVAKQKYEKKQPKQSWADATEAAVPQ
jgi:hypothetical protein